MMYERQSGMWLHSVRQVDVISSHARSDEEQFRVASKKDFGKGCLKLDP